jgi:hypothetical protein
MTELNHEYTPETAQQTPEWPGTAAHTIRDPDIAAIVEALDGVPEKPVAEHETVYSGLHDALLHALNEDAPHNGAREA